MSWVEDVVNMIFTADNPLLLKLCVTSVQTCTSLLDFLNYFIYYGHAVMMQKSFLIKDLVFYMRTI